MTRPTTEQLADDARRQAIIEHRRTMKEVREYGRIHRERIDAEWDALEAPPLTIEQHIAHVRKLREAQP